MEILPNLLHLEEISARDNVFKILLLSKEWSVCLKSRSTIFFFTIVWLAFEISYIYGINHVKIKEQKIVL